MSVITVKVAGVDRTDFVYKASPPSWEDLLNTRGTGSVSFEVEYTDLASFRPQDGQTVQVIEDGTVRFGGFLVEPAMTDLIDEETVIFSCGMKDNNSIADRRVITAEYEDVPFEDIVADILSPAGGNDGLKGEGITDGGVVAGNSLSIKFPTIYVVEAFNDLAVAAGGLWWNIGHDKDLDFAPRTAVAAPGPLTGDNTLKKTPTLRPTLEKYRNIEYVLAGKDDFPITAGYWASGEVVARAAIEGTTGRYEHIEERQDIVNPDLAEDLAIDLVNRFGEATLYFQCVTRDPGYASGQEVDLTFPALDLSAEAFLIDSVNAQVHYTSEDGDDIQEIWYTVTAITGDPFGGWMEHFRKHRPPSQKRDIVPAPGVTVECDPGVLVHDPPPGSAEWYEATPGGGFSDYATCFVMSHDGSRLYGVRKYDATYTAVDSYSISDNHVIDSSGGTFTFVSPAGNAGVKGSNAFLSPDGKYLAFAYYESNPTLTIVNLHTQTVSGSVATTLYFNGNSTRGAWLDDYIYWPNEPSDDIYVFDVSNVGSPTEAQIYTPPTLLSQGGKIGAVIPHPTDSDWFYVCSYDRTCLISIDRSTPDAIVEDSAIIYPDVNYKYNDMVAWENPDGDLCLYGFVNSIGANIAHGVYLIDPIDPGTISTLAEGLIGYPVLTYMQGEGPMIVGGQAMCWSRRHPGSGANTVAAHVFDVSNPLAVTAVEIFDFIHPSGSNLGPYGSLEAAHSAFLWSYGASGTQVVFAEVIYDQCEELETQWPLEVYFGGTGHRLYEPGDLLAAEEEELLGRVAIGEEAAMLMVDGTEALGMRWEPNMLWDVLELGSGQSAIPYPVVDGNDVILAAASSGEITIELPALADSLDRVMVIKNVGDGSSAVVIDPDSTEQIEGASTLSLPGENEAAIIVAGLTQWDVLAHKAADSGADHGSLAGLTDDDHTQYLLADGTRDLAGDWDAAGYDIAGVGLVEADMMVIADGGSGGTAGAFLSYGADDGTNYERGGFGHNGAILAIGSEAGGTGTLRPIGFYSAATLLVRMNVAGLVCINESSDTWVTKGLAINQIEEDDYIVTFKSDDIAHGITDYAETDTYGLIKKVHATDGALGIWGVGLGDYGTSIVGICTTGDTTKSTAALAPLDFVGGIKSGTAVAAMGSNENVAVWRDLTSTRMILDAEGELHIDLTKTVSAHAGHIEEFDEFDDVALCTGLRGVMLGMRAPDYLRTFVEYARPVLEAGGVVTFNPDGHHFGGLKALHALELDSIIQLGGRVRELERELGKLKGEG